MSILGMTLSASILILVVVAVRAMFLYRLPKITFLALWGIVMCRLLVPFSVPSHLSIYTLIDRVGSMVTAPAVAPVHAGGMIPPLVSTIDGPMQAALSAPALSPFVLVWLLGTIVCALFFIVTHVRCLREYQTALPIEHDLVTGWRQDHPTWRPVQIKQSDTIPAPLTYGIVRPVIVLPKTMDYTDGPQIRYILAHEYAHITRFDTLIKWLLAAALCLHWFNPLVWIMYILANRDLELACDETVVRTFGETKKSAYARALIGMEERKSRLTPFCTNFSKNSIEERIVSIMKTRKTTPLSILLALGLVIGIVTAFATSGISVPYPGDEGGLCAALEHDLEDDTTISPTELAKIEEQDRRYTAEKYSIYETYGLTYDIDQDRFYYNDVQVRYFVDTVDADGNLNGFSYENGGIDLKAVRNADYELIGIEPFSQADFDRRTQRILEAQNSMDALGIGDGGSSEAGDPDWVDDSLSAYASLGIYYDKTAKTWMYQHEPIHFLYDEDGITYLNAGSDGQNLRVVRDERGNPVLSGNMTLEEAEDILHQYR